jgi:alginate O-acetyltransferase complex protein AlgI
MVFSSHVFVFYFLPLALLLYYAGPRGMRNFTLTAVSYVFYGWMNPYFILLIAWSTVVDYCCGNLIYGHWRLLGPVTMQANGEPRASEVQRKLFVVVSLVSNLGMLFFFKYFMFAQENLNALRTALGAVPAEVLIVLLPVGISFYTFESISYNLDIYFGRARPAIVWVQALSGEAGARRPVWRRLGQELRALNAFACYITQFPHLVAGPIIRYQDLEAQVHLRTHTPEKFARGVFFFALGMGKKILIANPMGEIANAAFAAPGLHWFDAWYGVFAYAFQIYFDFSGYSDMAIGLGLMLGFEFAKNFASPYKAQSITEFWRRWHISLSTWLRDYLYVPLGGNRKGTARTYLNLFIVMVLGGMWHGAAWNFVIWGAIHGGWLGVERAMGKESFYARAPAVLRVAVTFLIVNIAWVFFKATDLESALAYLGSLFGLHHDLPATATLTRAVLYSPDHLLWITIAACIAFFGMETWDLSKRLTPVRATAAVALLVWSLVVMSTQSFSPFLYFQF